MINRKIIKTVTRALYIDGKPIAEFTQDPLEWSELADLENITARMELLERQKGFRTPIMINN